MRTRELKGVFFHTVSATVPPGLVGGGGTASLEDISCYCVFCFYYFLTALLLVLVGLCVFVWVFEGDQCKSVLEQ